MELVGDYGVYIDELMNHQPSHAGQTVITSDSEFTQGTQVINVSGVESGGQPKNIQRAIYGINTRTIDWIQSLSHRSESELLSEHGNGGSDNLASSLMTDSSGFTS